MLTKVNLKNKPRPDTKKRGDERMDEKTKRNELLITLADINNLIQKLENKDAYNKEEATDTTSQLLYAYDIKIKILNNI